MPKVYNKGLYVEVDPFSFENPHENLAYRINGRRYKFILCHWDYGGTIKGYNTHTKSWWDLYQNYVQKEGCSPIEAILIDGKY